MTEETCKERLQVARLDRSQPPPGYEVDDYSDVEFHWSAPDEHYGLGLDEHCGSGTKAECMAAARAHFEAEHDPPGLKVFRAERGSFVFGTFWVQTGGGMVKVGEADDKAAARVAAWAWYWRRVTVATRLLTGPFAPLTCECARPPKVWDGKGASLCRHVDAYLRILSADDWWPRALAWPDGLVAAVERWLTEGGEPPEVLRG